MTEQQDPENNGLDSKPTHRTETEMLGGRESRKRKSSEKAPHAFKVAKAQAEITNSQAKLEPRVQTEVGTEMQETHAKEVVRKSRVTKPPIRGTLFLGADDESPGTPNSFVVRVTLDPGIPSRVQIEHSQTGVKKSFVGLNGEQIVGFIQEQIEKQSAPKPAVEQPKAHASAEADKIPSPARSPQTQTAYVNVSRVWVSRPKAPGAACTFNPDEPILIDIHFEIEDADVAALSAEEKTYELKVYANPVSGKSIVLTHRTGKLVQGAAEYDAQVQVANLPAGFYRLFTVLTLDLPVKGAGYREGPTIEVRAEPANATRNVQDEIAYQVEGELTST